MHAQLQARAAKQTATHSEQIKTFARQCAMYGLPVCNSDGDSVGTGLYLQGMLLSHSCDPNCVACFEGAPSPSRLCFHAHRRVILTAGERLTSFNLSCRGVRATLFAQLCWSQSCFTLGCKAPFRSKCAASTRA